MSLAITADLCGRFDKILRCLSLSIWSFRGYHHQYDVPEAKITAEGSLQKAERSLDQVAGL